MIHCIYPIEKTKTGLCVFLLLLFASLQEGRVLWCGGLRTGSRHFS